MLRNYLTIAGRALQRRPGPTVINVLGLAVGLAACLLIALWVRHELSYDHFHPSAAQIHRIGLDLKMQDQELRGPITSAPLGPTLVDEMPEVRRATRFSYDASVGFQVDGRAFTGTRVVWADTSFFDVFDGFEMIHGTATGALDGTETIVLTASTARRFFGRTDVVGETIDLNDSVQEITAVLADPPDASHLQFDAVGSGEIGARAMEMWVSNNWYTYVQLLPGTAPARLQGKLDEMVERYVAPQVQQFLGTSFDQLEEQGARFRYYTQPLLDIHLHSNTAYEFQPNGSITYVYIFSAIALFLLLIACINFMNLATARAAERATEVGMRKALGAGRPQLAGQFLGEAVLTTAVATLLALALALAGIPLFNQIAGSNLGWTDVLDPWILLGSLGLIGVVGLVAGSYPALVLSRFQPATVLKSNDRHSSGGHGGRLRQGLVVFQFAVSIALIGGTFVVQQQFDYVQTKQIGLDKERVAVVSRAWTMGEQQPVFVERVRQIPGVAAASAGVGLFRGGMSNTVFIPDDAPMSTSRTINFLSASFGVVDALGIEVIAGRAFDPSRTSDSTAVLVNQALARSMGWTDPVGHRLREPSPDGKAREYTVIGMVNDFHYQSMHYDVEPLLIRPQRAAQSIYVRFAPGDPSAALAQMETLWAEVNPNNPIQYRFLDQSYAELHRDTQRTSGLFRAFAGIAIIIACLGLFGLATYTVQRRTREIGIRKALGASGTQIVTLLSREFVALVAIAFLVAWPVAYLGMQRWLDDFAYQIDLGVGVFLGAGALAMSIALVTIGYHTLQATRVEPSVSLRSE